MHKRCETAATARIQPARRVKRAQSTIERAVMMNSPRNQPARRVNRAESTIERVAAQPARREKRTASTTASNVSRQDFAVANITSRNRQGTYT